MSLLERKESLKDIFIVSLGALTAGLCGSVIILIVSFIIGGQSDIFSNLGDTKSGLKFGGKIETLYSIFFALITLVGSSITLFITYKILGAINPEKYRKNFIIFSQIAFFQILVFLFISPIYLYFGGNTYENSMLTFIFHILITIFGTNIILDILNNYRYVMIGIYGNFIGLFISLLISIGVFNSLSNGNAKLFSLLFLLPIINFLIIFIKKIFELVYFHFYTITGTDPIGDIFYKIQKEDEENEKEEFEKNLI